MKKLTKAQYHSKAQYHLFVALAFFGMAAITGIFITGILIYAVFTGQVF